MEGRDRGIVRNAILIFAVRTEEVRWNSCRLLKEVPQHLGSQHHGAVCCMVLSTFNLT